MMLAACNGTPQVSLTPSIDPAVSVTPEPSAVVSPLETQNSPTNTPAPIIVEKIEADLVLWAPAGSDPARVQALTGQLQAFADQKGILFETLEQLSADMLGESVRVLVSLAPAAEIASLAAAHPAKAFIAFGVEGVQASANLSAVVEDGVSLEDRAFMAGYLLALTTYDYRVGVISQAGTDEGLRTAESFTVGVQFYCGLCNSRYGPVLYYPRGAQITDPANPGDWKAAADLLLADYVKAVFVQPEVSSPELVAYLQTAGVTLVGVAGQPGLNDSPAWIAVIGSDSAGSLTNALEHALNGETVGLVPTGLALSQVNRDLLSEGRQGLFERTVRDLEAGLIRTTPFR